VPIPRPNLPRPRAQYRFAGALIGIAIRSGLAQDFGFPRCVWQYFVTGALDGDRICEIDPALAALRASVREAKAPDQIDALGLRFTVRDWRGHEVALLPNGKVTPVTIRNCEHYIELAIGERIREMLPQLEWMRAGLCGNLGFEIPPWLDPGLLEVSASGQAEISMEILRGIVTCRRVRDEIREMFWKIAEALTGEEWGLLLMFATSRPRLPPDQADGGGVRIVVEEKEGRDSMPTAWTCFSKIAVPRYSSLAIGLKLVRLAIALPSRYAR
jgi:hypothetical protein